MTSRAGAAFSAAMGMCITACLAAAPRTGSAASMPDWATAIAADSVASTFPDAKTIQVLAHTHCRMSSDGSREFTIRNVFFVRSGKGEDCGSASAVKSAWSKPLGMTAWRQDEEGRVERFTEPGMTQIAEGSLYQDEERYVLSVPGIGPGTLVAFETRLQTSFPVFGSLVAPTRVDIPVYRWALTFAAPEGVEPEGFWLDPARDSLVPASATISERGEFGWRRDKSPALGDAEPGQPTDAWLAPRLLIRWPKEPGGALQTWKDVVDWYRPISESAFGDDGSLAAALDAIRARCAAVPPGGRSPEYERQCAVADLVRSKIGYVQIYLKDGGIRPHKVVDVYNNRYGDCKDMAHLAIALLRGMGERAYPVLTDTDADPAIRDDFPTASFNHCIVAIEDPSAAGGIRFFDPTAKNIPFGRIPPGLQRAPALIIGPGVQSRLDRLPVESASENGHRSTARLTLDERLNVSGAVSETYYGHPAYEMRAWLQEQKAENRAHWLAERFSDRSVRSTVTEIRFGNLDEIEDSLRIEYVLWVPGSARQIGDKVIWHPDVLPRDARRAYPAETRQRPVRYRYPGRWEKAIEAAIPDGWTAEEIPAAVSIDNSVGSYERTILFEDGSLEYRSTAVFDSTFIPVESYGLIQALDQARSESDRKGLLLRVPG